MISRREKTKRQLFREKQQVFLAQVRALTNPTLSLSGREVEAVRQEFHFDSIYSRYGYGGNPTSSGSRSRSGGIKGSSPRANLFSLENLKTPKDLIGSPSELSRESTLVIPKRSRGLGKKKLQRAATKVKGENVDSGGDNKKKNVSANNRNSGDSKNIPSNMKQGLTNILQLKSATPKKKQPSGSDSEFLTEDDDDSNKSTAITADDILSSPVASATFSASAPAWGGQGRTDTT